MRGMSACQSSAGRRRIVYRSGSFTG
ncbi:hypothetical protein RHECNPAF_750054 [Rhizobium etli CNPAF512]|nr:hypothetical protein RHECNPAF_750054 [Rhizobium etli CNPAF512]